MFNLLFIMSPMDSDYRLKEAKLVLESEFKDKFSMKFMDTYHIDENPQEFNSCMEEIKNSDMVFITSHGGITFFKSLSKILEEYEGKKKFFIHSGIDDENLELLKKSGISQREYSEILKYYSIGDSENLKNMVLYISSNMGGEKFSFQSPKAPTSEGIYYDGKIVQDYKRYINEIKKFNKPIVGILFYSKYMNENNVKHIDGFIKEVEALGAVPLAIYTSVAPNLSIGARGFKWTVENILMDGGVPVVDVIINTIGYSQSILSNPGDGNSIVSESIYETIGVPVLQAMNTYQDYETWRKSLRGIDMMSFVGSVYYPEFDGQIITVTTSYTEREVDEVGEKLVFKPIEERVNKVCRLALNWAKLRRMDNKEKKVAILFHNMPPRNDMIGCAFGLDTPTSVLNMVNALKEDGVHTEYDFQNGDEIINKIINAVSNDMRWLSPEKSLERSVDVIPGDLYRQWFSALSENVREKMIHDWDTPPGEFMVHDDKLPVPGIINGNIFIGLQPPRGYEEKADEVYHSTDIVPPHQYIALYKWIKHVFKADVIAHIGTHGTVEWLPGKEIGLSEECYTDISLDDMPHLYPYSIDVLGEGIQAKRRGSAVILDHLIPSLMQSGTYGEMETIEDLIKQYYHAQKGDNGKLKYIQDEIVELVIKNNFHIDLKTTEEEIKADFEGFMQTFHGWIEEIKNSLVKDGLHIYGTVPEGERYENLVCALLRIANGEVLSLVEAVCTTYGIDYNHIKDNPYETDDFGNTNLMLLDEIERISRDMIKKLHATDYNIEVIEETIKSTIYKFDGASTEIHEVSPSYKSDKNSHEDKNILHECGKALEFKQFAPSIYDGEENLQGLIKTLKFASIDVKEKLHATTDEIKYFIEGTNGRFVPPASGGSPTRGRVDILPTGRNFYSIDPTSVPTRASWKVGKQLGDNLIQRYINDEGKHPETVAIIVYSGETMKTCGDDIAEILYLMGVKPKWLGSTDKVIGIEVIPLEELKRPRVDVTLRISGLFRDTFPNLIELVEDAVNLVASLEEPEELNNIRKNVLKEIKELLDGGMSRGEAEAEASMRIFGCPPGTYGAGVEMLINSKNWESVNDLGDVYTLWGGHAYGRKVHGKKVKNVFERRMAVTEVTVKNESSQEIDMLDSDDFYNYHGGLIASVRTYSGKAPRAYCGDTSDPSRVKLKDVNEETARIMRSRILNPKWFEGLTKHGYKGAQEISGMVDFAFGWDATAEVVEDWMYEGISEMYLFNDERREWIKSVNPWAIHSMVERLLEANQRGMWNAKEESVEKLRELYLGIEGDIEEFF